MGERAGQDKSGSLSNLLEDKDFGTTICLKISPNQCSMSAYDNISDVF